MQYIRILYSRADIKFMVTLWTGACALVVCHALRTLLKRLELLESHGAAEFSKQLQNIHSQRCVLND